MLKYFCLSLAAITASSPVAAQEAAPDAKLAPKTVNHAELAKNEAEAAWARAPIVENEVRHRDSVTVNGKSYPYIASAGTLTTRDSEGKPTASFAVVAVKSVAVLIG